MSTEIRIDITDYEIQRGIYCSPTRDAISLALTPLLPPHLSASTTPTGIIFFHKESKIRLGEFKYPEHIARWSRMFDQDRSNVKPISFTITLPSV